MALPTLLSLIPAGVQLAQSFKQNRDAQNLKKSNFMPQGLKENAARARNLANASVSPGYSQTVDAIKGATADTVNTAKKVSTDSGSVASAVAAADANEKKALLNLNKNNELFKLNAQDNLFRANSQVASIEEKNEDQFRAAESSLKGASIQNKYNAVSNAAAVGVDALTAPDTLTKTVTSAGGSSGPKDTTAGITVPGINSASINSRLRGVPSRAQLTGMSPDQLNQLYGTSDVNKILARLNS